MNALELIKFFNYDYRDLAIVLLVVEQREGREKADRLLDEIPAPSVQKNARYFVNSLRALVEEQEAGSGSEIPPSNRSKLPGEKKYGKQSVLKES